MSRTKRKGSKKNCGYDYWGRRAQSGNCGYGKRVKKRTTRIERNRNKRAVCNGEIMPMREAI